MLDYVELESPHIVCTAAQMMPFKQKRLAS